MLTLARGEAVREKYFQVSPLSLVQVHYPLLKHGAEVGEKIGAWGNGVDLEVLNILNV